MTQKPLAIALTHVDLPNETKGGVAHVVHHLGNQLVMRGHEVTMFTQSPFFEQCLYRVHQLPSSRHASKLASFAFAFQLRNADFSSFDVVHTHGDNYLLHAKPQVRTFHGAARDELASAASWQRKLKQLLLISLEKRGGRAATLCTGVSLATQKRIPVVSRVIANGVDLTRFLPGPKSKNPTILFVGTAGGRKRGSFLAEIFALEVLPKFPTAELWSVADAPLQGQNIRNLGRVSLEELARLNREAWVFCLPSTYEGFGIPYIEAMAWGTPVVASPNPGALEILQDGKWGVVASDEKIGQAINGLLGNAAEREKWTQLGLERTPDFSWESVTLAYEAVYREAMEMCARRGAAKP